MSRGLGWRMHESVEDTKLSTNKQHTLSLKINWIESHANVVVLQEEIKFPNIKNHHVIKNLWKRKTN